MLRGRLLIAACPVDCEVGRAIHDASHPTSTLSFCSKTWMNGLLPPAFAGQTCNDSLACCCAVSASAITTLPSIDCHTSLGSVPCVVD